MTIQRAVAKARQVRQTKELELTGGNCDISLIKINYFVSVERPASRGFVCSSDTGMPDFKWHGDCTPWV